MHSMTHLLADAIAASTELLSAATDLSWEAPAGDLEWSCRATAAHIADDLFSYASQVIAQPQHGFLPIEAVLEPTATTTQVVDAITMCSRLLQNAVDLTDPAARAWHPCGTSDAVGFAAMGAVETLVHTYDIAQGLGLMWTPPAELCAPLLDRLFPQAPQGEPSAVLLYSCGRAALGPAPRLSDWTWDSSVRSA